jgi:hypothetical protein
MKSQIASMLLCLVFLQACSSNPDSVGPLSSPGTPFPNNTPQNNIPNQTDTLFTTVDQPENIDAVQDSTIIRSRFVAINFDLLTGAEGSRGSKSDSDTLNLNLFDDIFLTVVLDRVETDPSGSFTWIGHVKGNEPSRVSLSIAGEMMSGEVETHGVFYRVEHVENGIHMIYEYEQAISSSGEGPPGLDSTPHVSPQVPVTVTHVEARTLETNPDQVELIIQGTLPDQCEYEIFSYEVRSGNTVNVTVEGIHPPETCENIEQHIEYTLLLGRDAPEEASIFTPGNYEVIVNGYPSEFSIAGSDE